ncbi:MAG: phage tail tape measure protein [gamma proteobacterium symbiont of Taylorina sp.]|nr:phage tail tape measure protein [gamma proteobacterium symbiont of Taylorina sp.]
MADLQKTVEIIFGGKDNLSPTTKSLTKELGSFDSAVQGAAAPIGNFTENLLKTEAAILAMGLAMVGVSLNQAGTFSGSIEEIGVLFNGTEEEVNQLRIMIMDYARDSSSSIEDIIKSTYNAVSAGAEWTTVITDLSAAEQLADAGASDLAKATEAIASVMAGFGLELSETTKVAEALFTATQTGKTTISELGDNIGKVAAIASASGVSYEDLLSALSSLTVDSVNTKLSMTGLKALFNEMVKPTSALTTALGGASFETHSLQEVMETLKEKTGGTYDGFAKLFGSVEAARTALILANDTSGTFAKTLEAMEERTGKLKLAYERMAKSFDIVNQNLVNNLRVTLIQTGLPLLDEYGTAVKALAHIFEGIGEGVKAPNFQEIYSAIEVFVNNFSAKMEDIATALPEAMGQIDFSDLIRSFSDLSETVGGALDGIFGDDLDLSKPEDLAKVLQSAVNILTSFVDLTTGIVTGLQPVFDILGEAASKTGTVGEEAAKTTGEILGAITLLHEFGTVLGATLTLIKEIETDITNVFSTFEGAARIVTNSFQVVFDGFIATITGLAANLASSMAVFTTGDLKASFQKAADDLNEISGVANKNLLKNSAEMKDGWNTMVSGLSGDAAKAGTAIKDVGDKTNELGEKFSKVQGSADAVGNDLQNLGDKADGAKTPIKELTKDLAEMGGVEAVPSTIPKNIKKVGDEAVVSDEKFKGFTRTIGEDGIPIFTATGQALDEVKTKTELSAEEAEKAAIAFAQMEVDLEKIASNERIKSMEFSVDFAIANVESDAKKVIAAFESISESYTATSDLIGSLYGEKSDVSRFDQLGIDSSIDKAEKLADDQWKTQKKLIEQQIKQMQAQTKRMASGGALITVDGGELQPELELVMQALFKNIRIKMSSDYEDYLLALGQV